MLKVFRGEVQPGERGIHLKQVFGQSNEVLGANRGELD
jgi:hypothetical protein